MKNTEKTTAEITKLEQKLSKLKKQDKISNAMNNGDFIKSVNEREIFGKKHRKRMQELAGIPTTKKIELKKEWKNFFNTLRSLKQTAKILKINTKNLKYSEKLFVNFLKLSSDLKISSDNIEKKILEKTGEKHVDFRSSDGIEFPRDKDIINKLTQNADEKSKNTKRIIKDNTAFANTTTLPFSFEKDNKAYNDLINLLLSKEERDAVKSAIDKLFKSNDYVVKKTTGKGQEEVKITGEELEISICTKLNETTNSKIIVNNNSYVNCFGKKLA